MEPAAPHTLFPRWPWAWTFRLVLLLAFGAALLWTGRPAAESTHTFQAFAPFVDPTFSRLELVALLSVVAVAIAGLLYAFVLARQVVAADRGTASMQEVAAAIRQGSNAYLAAQFRRIGPLIAVITLLLFVTYAGSEPAFRCLLYTSPSPRDGLLSRMPSSA